MSVAPYRWVRAPRSVTIRGTALVVVDSSSRYPAPQYMDRSRAASPLPGNLYLMTNALTGVSVTGWGAPLPPDHAERQLLPNEAVDLQPREGTIAASSSWSASARLQPATSARPALPRAQPLRERAAEMAQGVRGPWRRGLHREAALLPRGGPGGENSGAGAFLWQARTGARGPKKDDMKRLRGEAR